MSGTLKQTANDSHTTATAECTAQRVSKYRYTVLHSVKQRLTLISRELVFQAERMQEANVTRSEDVHGCHSSTTFFYHSARKTETTGRPDFSLARKR